MPRLTSVAVVAALAALVSAIASGTAFASGPPAPHLLNMYKVEKQVDLKPNGLTKVTAACNNGDYVIDPMWRFDHLDQVPGFNAGGLDPVTALRAPESYGEPNLARWHFTFRDPSPGRGQAKVFLTCLGKKTTKVAGHFHQVAPPTNTGNQSFTAAGPHAGFAPTQCGPGQVAIAPAFRFSQGSGRLIASRMSLYGGEPPQYRNWSMAFDPTPNAQWTTSFRCLSLTLSAAGSPSHQPSIVTSLVSGHDLIGTGTTEVQRICGDQAKGMIGGLDISVSDVGRFWFLGMDPRIKTRAFSLFNSGPGPINVETDLLCFDDSTD